MTDSSANAGAWVRSPSDYENPPEFGAATVRRSCYVATRDGTRLATDVYLPADLPEGSRLPAIVMFTPYYRRLQVRAGCDADGIGPSIGYARDAFVPYGYALVTVDVRGTGASFGARKGFRSPKERLDYADVAQWIVDQSWCDGRLGATGISYAGAAADFLASSGHPAVRAIIPSFAVWDTYKDMFYPGGLLCTTVQDAYGSITTALDRNDKTIVAGHPYFSNPAYDGPAPVDGDDGTLLKQALNEHTANFEMVSFIQALNCRDSSPLGDPDLTAAEISPATYASSFREDVAVYSVSGWRDGFGYADAAVRRHATLKTQRKHLILGPWDHGAVTHVSPLRTKETPQFELLNEYRRFFDHYLKAEAPEFAREAPVHYFTLIEEKWKSSDAWPPRETSLQRFYLHRAGCLSTATPSEDDSSSVYQVDFTCSSGHDTRYERIGLKNVESYYASWPSVAGQRLSFTTEPFAAGVEITGHAQVTLFMESSSCDGAIFAYLEDIDEKGQAAYITEGVLRLIHRGVASTDPSFGPVRNYLRSDVALVSPGAVIEVSLGLIPVSWMVLPGHRVRFSIAGADASHFARVPVGETPTWNILHNAGHPSHFSLPVMPRHDTVG